jgi:hypothetical protein
MRTHTCGACGDQGHHAKTCVESYPGIRGRLGLDADTDLATQYGTTASAVRTMRRRLGIGYARRNADAAPRSLPRVPVAAVAAGLDVVAAALATGGDRAVTITTTDGLLALALDARRRDSNRQADLEALAAVIDPGGVHVLVPHWLLVHNEVEWRTCWMVKVRDEHQPVQLWLDVSFDAYDTFTRRVQIDGAPTAAEA